MSSNVAPAPTQHPRQPGHHQHHGGGLGNHPDCADPEGAAGSPLHPAVGEVVRIGRAIIPRPVPRRPPRNRWAVPADAPVRRHATAASRILPGHSREAGSPVAAHELRCIQLQPQDVKLCPAPRGTGGGGTERAAWTGLAARAWASFWFAPARNGTRLPCRPHDPGDGELRAAGGTSGFGAGRVGSNKAGWGMPRPCRTAAVAVPECRRGFRSRLGGVAVGGCLAP